MSLPRLRVVLLALAIVTGGVFAGYVVRQVVPSYRDNVLLSSIVEIEVVPGSGAMVTETVEKDFNQGQPGLVRWWSDPRLTTLPIEDLAVTRDGRPETYQVFRKEIDGVLSIGYRTGKSGEKLTGVHRFVLRYRDRDMLEPTEAGLRFTWESTSQVNVHRLQVKVRMPLQIASATCTLGRRESCRASGEGRHDLSVNLADVPADTSVEVSAVLKQQG